MRPLERALYRHGLRLPRDALANRDDRQSGPSCAGIRRPTHPHLWTLPDRPQCHPDRRGRRPPLSAVSMSGSRTGGSTPSAPISSPSSDPRSTRRDSPSWPGLISTHAPRTVRPRKRPARRRHRRRRGPAETPASRLPRQRNHHRARSGDWTRHRATTARLDR